MFQRWQTWVAACLIAVILLLALFAPYISPPDDPDHPRPLQKAADTTNNAIPQPPTREALFGTTPHQFDVFHTVVWGTREAVLYGLGVTLITAMIGTLIGAISAYIGGFLNNIFSRFTDAFLAFPLIAAIPLMQLYYRVVFATVFPPHLSESFQIAGMPAFQLAEGEIQLYIQLMFVIFTRVNPFTLALILFAWIPYARLVNDQILRLKKYDFVLAARSIGATNLRIIGRHLLPNSYTPIVVWATKSIGGLVILQATFTYIGLGGGSSWASLLSIGKDWIIGPGGNLFAHWWVYLPITAAIILFGFAWNWLGDELNIWLNPRETR